MYKAMDISKWFIEKGIKEGKPLTPMQVLKLTYIAQGIYFAMYNQPLFYNSVEAWKYGPVVKSVYQNLRKFGKSPIRSIADIDFRGINPEDSETITILENIYKTFGYFSAYQLSSWTHRKGSAWDVAYHENGGYKYLGYDIELELLKAEFSQIVSPINKKRNIEAGWQQ